jgi:hypothetical protein
MSKFLMLLVTATIAFTSIASNNDPGGFNYKKHYKKAKKKKKLDRMFNRNKCWGKSYYNIR